MSGFATFQWFDLLDIILIWILLYKLIMWTKDTQAFRVLKGIAFLFICSLVSQILQLNTISWALDSFLKSGTIIIVLVILFQPEFRRILERLGTGGSIIGGRLTGADDAASEAAIQTLKRSILSMSKRRVGMLVVFEHNSPLGDVMKTGKDIDAIISGPLLENIFEPNTPLHDGAVIVRGNRIASAACILPLSNETGISLHLGTRHRAALGISSVSDCVALVVSEETGTISKAENGRIERYLDETALQKLLESQLLEKKETPFGWLKRGMKA